jgi:DNA helicase II / ATP-dependent DNA helicase PcrA
MTRAKHQLDLMVPQRFYVHQQSRGGDRHLYALRTRFVPEALLALFEQRTWPVRAEEPGVGGTGSSNARVDIAARLRARWR